MMGLGKYHVVADEVVYISFKTLFRKTIVGFSRHFTHIFQTIMYFVSMATGNKTRQVISPPGSLWTFYTAFNHLRKELSDCFFPLESKLHLYTEHNTCLWCEEGRIMRCFVSDAIITVTRVSVTSRWPGDQSTYHSFSDSDIYRHTISGVQRYLNVNCVIRRR